MVNRVAGGVFVNESGFLQSNSVVLVGDSGVLLVDPGITGSELDALADVLHDSRHTVVAGFATHPHWDHVLWHPGFGDAPRYATATAVDAMRELLASDDWEDQVAEGLPPEHAHEIPMRLLGLVTALPEAAGRIPWDGPSVRVLEHRAHAPGHAALLVEPQGVLVAGDMLSDILIPFLDLAAADPIGDYLHALDLFDSVADRVRVVVPGHGSVGDGEHLRARIALDRAYVEAVHHGRDVDDPRLGEGAPLYWLPDVHDWQVRHLAELGHTTT